jgi:hypothetical protein
MERERLQTENTAAVLFYLRCSVVTTGRNG